MNAFNFVVFRRAIREGRIVWRKHVLQRLAERNISREEILDVLLTGEPINEYPDDSPYPSVLFLGYSSGRPLHVLSAFDSKQRDVYIITTYEPSLNIFENDYKTRKQNE